jgi:hypothetical protein
MNSVLCVSDCRVTSDGLASQPTTGKKCGSTSTFGIPFHRPEILPNEPGTITGQSSASPGLLTSFSFRRVDAHAPNARIVIVDAQGEHEIPRSRRIHLLGDTRNGTSRVGLSYDPDLTIETYGAGSGPTGAFVLRSERVADGWRFHAISAETDLPSGFTLDFPSNEDSLPNSNAAPTSLDHPLDGESPA